MKKVKEIMMETDINQDIALIKQLKKIMKEYPNREEYRIESYVSPNFIRIVVNKLEA